jgi:predicted transcriptional regulator
MKLLGQKINVAKIRIEILENYKNKINLNEINKKIEYNKVLTNNELKRLKEKYFDSIQSHLNKIKFLKMKLLKFEESFMNINKHKNHHQQLIY